MDSALRRLTHQCPAASSIWMVVLGGRHGDWRVHPQVSLTKEPPITGEPESMHPEGKPLSGFLRQEEATFKTSRRLW